MDQEKLLLQYQNNDLLLINVENERCENKYENSIKDENKQIKILTNGNFLILNAKKRMISQYILTKNYPVCSKFVRVQLKVLVFSKEETIIMGGDEKGYVYVWNRYTGRLINSFQAHYGSINNVVIDPNINVVYTHGDEHFIHVYDLNDILSKRKIKSIAKYQHNVYDRIRQIIPITPNAYYPYKTLISLTYSGCIYIFGLLSEYPTDVLKTKSSNCNFICSNELFNTHLYLCKGNEIYRIGLIDDTTDANERNRKECSVSKVHRNFSKQTKSEKRQYKDDTYKLNKGIKVDVSTNGLLNVLQKDDEIKRNQMPYQHGLLYNYDTNDTDSSCYDSDSSSDVSSTSEGGVHTRKCSFITHKRNLRMKDYTAFIGHKNEVLKCNVNEKKNWLLSLAKDGIRVWDLFNCYTIKILKYGENIIDFFIPSPKLCSYFIEFPNLVMEYEEEVKLNIISEIVPGDVKTNDDFFLKKENPLLNMALMFSEKRI